MVTKVPIRGRIPTVKKYVIFGTASIRLPGRPQLLDLYHIRVISYILGKNDALD